MPALSMLERLDNVLFLKLLFWSIFVTFGIIASISGGITLTAAIFGIFMVKYNTVIGLLFIKLVGVILTSWLLLILGIVALASIS